MAWRSKSGGCGWTICNLLSGIEIVVKSAINGGSLGAAKIPPCHQRGTPDSDLTSFLRDEPRAPEQMLGDEFH